jgi:hypothetical protein
MDFKDRYKLFHRVLLLYLRNLILISTKSLYYFKAKNKPISCDAGMIEDFELVS